MMAVDRLQILFQDQDIVVVQKPAGLLVHRTSLAFGEHEACLQILKNQIQCLVYPVHRLDRPTSGALIFALSKDMARHLALQFSEQKIEKKYLAVVRGYAPDRGVIDYPLTEELDKIADKNARENKAPQKAVTEFERLARVELPIPVDRYPSSRYSLVQAIPKTGRKHQIRRHLRHLGHPLLGDINYGVGKHNRFFADHFSCKRLLLACTEISFAHPRSQEKMTVRSPLCEDYKDLLSKLDWSHHAT
jgi:tRNA pseudouridine65 synthase